MKKATLPYSIVNLAASLFSSRFNHSGLTAFFCDRLDKHPNDLSIPELNKHDKFIWLLGQLPLQEQRRVLEQLCATELPLEVEEDRKKLLRMLGSSPIQIPSPAPGKLDTQYISEAWEKARERRTEDPEGAITAARILLESVCKHILEDIGVAYADKDDLPKLYGMAAKELNLAPSQHTEEAFKKILGGAHSVVDGLANLRNRIGDAHGQGKRPVKPLPRHAELAVNMAGTVASFLLATFEAKK